MDDGRASVGEALALADKTEERCWQAALNRIKGELLLAVSSNNHAESESCFSQALDMARNQQAKSWELRRALEELRSRELHPEEERRLVYARAFAAKTSMNFPVPARPSKRRWKRPPGNGGGNCAGSSDAISCPA